MSKSEEFLNTLDVIFKDELAQAIRDVLQDDQVYLFHDAGSPRLAIWRKCDPTQERPMKRIEEIVTMRLGRERINDIYASALHAPAVLHLLAAVEPPLHPDLEKELKDWTGGEIRSKYYRDMLYEKHGMYHDPQSDKWKRGNP